MMHVNVCQSAERIPKFSHSLWMSSNTVLEQSHAGLAPDGLYNGVSVGLIGGKFE